MFHVVKMQPNDYQFAAELANTINWDMTPEDFEFNAALEPNGCFILFENATRIGAATCISYGNVGWFGNLIVEPAFRGKGAGTLLVNHAANYLQNLGVNAVGLYAYQHLVNFYGSIGFKPDVEFAVLKATQISSVKSEKMQRAQTEDAATIVKLDSECFGANRQKLLKPILKNKGNACFIAKEGNKISDFAVAKIYSSMAEVGPLVSSTTDTAEKLLSAVLCELQGLEAWMCMPTSENALLKLSLEAGFVEEFRVVRMFLGSVSFPHCVYIAESLERG